MATSPNYSWPEPDNTDLVKNGALAIRTMGNAIDTTMATMTPKSTYTAKGSIAAATGASTPANLSVGNNGETLVADSSTSTGLRYQATMAAGRNAVINGGMDIWQRGTSVAVAASTVAYTADRLSISTAASQASTVSRQATNDTTNLPNIQYCARVQRNSGQTGTGTMYVGNSIETINSIPFTGKAVTVSFYARKGADYSATSSALNLYLWNGTGTDQNVNTGYTGANVVASVTATLTTTWQRFSFTGTVPTNSTELALQYQSVPTGTASTNDYYEITGVQLEIGSVATAFSRTGGTIAGELVACQRYYWRMGGKNAYEPLAEGNTTGTTAGYAAVKSPVTMRIVPSSIDYSTLGAAPLGSAPVAIATATIAGCNNDLLLISFTGTGFAVLNTAIYVTANNSTSAYLGFNAEL